MYAGVVNPQYIGCKPKTDSTIYSILFLWKASNHKHCDWRLFLCSRQIHLAQSKNLVNFATLMSTLRLWQMIDLNKIIHGINRVVY